MSDEVGTVYLSLSDDDEYSEEEEGTSNGSNAALALHSKKKNSSTTERKTFHLSNFAWNMLVVCKKGIYQTSTPMHTCVEKMS
jgi:hypothetical protein